jgi:hypothetical protein
MQMQRGALAIVPDCTDSYLQSSGFSTPLMNYRKSARNDNKSSSIILAVLTRDIEELWTIKE